jgi:hypothetical protein
VASIWNCIQSARLAGDFASHANAALLIGTVKPPPAAQSENRFPLKVAPNYPTCPVCSAPAKRDFLPCAIRPRLAQPENQKRRLQMTDSNETKTVTSRTPSHFAYNVRNREGGDNYWIRIGSAWAHADGKGFNIQLETVPLDGRIALRVASEKAK